MFDSMTIGSLESCLVALSPGDPRDTCPRDNQLPLVHVHAGIDVEPQFRLFKIPLYYPHFPGRETVGLYTIGRYFGTAMSGAWKREKNSRKVGIGNLRLIIFSSDGYIDK